MAQFLDFDGLSLYDSKVKRRTSQGYYNKDEVDNLISGVESNTTWKNAVATYADIATTYPYPRQGWTVTVLDTGMVYYFDGNDWIVKNGTSVPKATSTTDGLMPKEMYSKVDSLGTAALKDYTATLDTSSSLPTSEAVQTYVNAALTQLNQQLEGELMLKVGIDDVGDASERDYVYDIPEESERISIKGEWYSTDDNTLFYLKGEGVNDGVDMSFFEEFDNYTIQFGLLNYSTPVEVKLHVTGTKTDPETSEVIDIDTYYDEGDVLSINEVPDEYLAGTDSAKLEVTIPDYEEYNISKIDVLVWPIFFDAVNNIEVNMVDPTAYENEVVIHQEYDILLRNHIVIGKYGLYSSSDLPTSSAVSALVRTVASALQQVLEAKIDEVEAKIDDYEEATDEDIEALFGGNSEVTDEDIENLFG